MASTQKLFLEDTYLQTFSAHVISVDPQGIQLSASAFYATSGGQPGDVGILTGTHGTTRITATQKGKTPDDILHLPLAGDPLPAPGDIVTGQIDWETRHRHMRMHTAMHLICSLITGYATGNQIGTEKSRIDFDIPTGAYDPAELTTRLRHLIAEDHPISYRWITDDELAANPSLVRTMSVKPPTGTGRVRLVHIGSPETPIDLQPCGGTHVRRTGEIGTMTVTKIENKGKQNRRLYLQFGS
ncbi:MAG: alanyl-tRNA editing protein [Alphaproteobacteria bacterium]|nr:alanyl-tRNA editing protein [Alphaproteobacteria bacterium]